MKQIPILLISICILAVSCKKENNKDVTNPLQNKIKTSKSVLGNGTVSNEAAYLYDEQGRLVKIAAVVGSTIEYRYEPGKVFVKTTQSNGSIENSIWNFSENGGVANQTLSFSNFIYLFNEEGYTKKLLIPKYNNNGIWYETELRDYYYSNTGLLDSIVFFKNSVKDGITIYSEYTDKPDLFNEQTGRSFIPKQWKNFYKRTTLKDPQGNIYSVSTLEHEFDTKGRRAKAIVMQNGNLLVTHTYTYYD